MELEEAIQMLKNEEVIAVSPPIINTKYYYNDAVRTVLQALENKENEIKELNEEIYDLIN